MVTGMLRSAGWHIGSELDTNLEADVFRELNEWLLELSGGSWQYPMPFKDLLLHEPSAERACAHLKELIAGRIAGRFANEPSELNKWLWKDPRTTFTLPIWQRIFPGLRVIQVTRHGIDVAKSLQVRAFRALDKPDWAVGHIEDAADLVALKWVLVGTRPLSIEAGLQLWSEYVTEADTHVRLLGDDAITLRYEDLLSAPEVWLERLFAFIGVDKVPPALVDSARLRADRSFAFLKDEELVRIASEHEELLGVHGYGPRGRKD
jgi:hypothetical protein